MIGFLQQFNPVAQALIATLFTWGVTAAGAALVFSSKTINQKFQDSLPLGINSDTWPWRDWEGVRKKMGTLLKTL